LTVFFVFGIVKVCLVMSRLHNDMPGWKKF
jgi:hypothetical protein